MTRRTVLLSLLVSSCAAPNLRPEVTPLTARAVGLQGASPQIAADWWTTLGDPQLDRIMADALAGNPTLAGAMARVRFAESTIESRRAEERPQIVIDTQEQRTRLSEKYIIPPPYGGSSRWVGTAQAGLTWTLDFWGRQAAMVEQARATARAASLDSAAARLAISGSIAQSYVELIRAEQQAIIAQSFVVSREQSVRLIRSRIRNQLASEFDARAAETLLDEARQAAIRAGGRREIAVHALAALAGRGADYYPTIGPATLALDRALPMPEAMPADLLGRRPDLLAGIARIDAAAGGRTVARKAYYPNVNLLAAVGVQALRIGALFGTAASTYGGGPAIHIPIFEGGRLHADYAGATAQLDNAVADYNAAVLRAVRETADAIADVRTDSADAAAQARIVGELQQVVRLDQTRVGAGLGSQLDILASGTRLLSARQAATDIAADAAIRRVQLVVALGGGFDPTQRSDPFAEARQ